MQTARRVALVLAITSIVAVAADNEGVGFSPSTTVKNQGTANDAFVADVTGDGIPDLITDHFKLSDAVAAYQKFDKQQMGKGMIKPD